MNSFNWNDLKFFLNLVRTGNPMHAAKLLGVDQTTVRRRISSLEQSLKTRLFDKQDDRYTLTTQGEALLESSEKVEAEITGISNAIAGDDVALSGVVRIGAPDALGSFFLAPCLSRLREIYPNLKVELVAMSRQFNLTKREADLAIMISRPLQGRHIIRKLIDCRLYLFASQAYLESRSPIQSLADLHGHQFIGYLEQLDFSPDLDTNSEIYRELSKPQFASSNLVAQASACAAGAGICLLPRYAVELFSNLKPVMKDDFHVDREIWILVHSDLRDIPRYRITMEYILKEVARLKPLFS